MEGSEDWLHLQAAIRFPGSGTDGGILPTFHLVLNPDTDCNFLKNFNIGKRGSLCQVFSQGKKKFFSDF